MQTTTQTHPRVLLSLFLGSWDEAQVCRCLLAAPGDETLDVGQTVSLKDNHEENPPGSQGFCHLMIHIASDHLPSHLLETHLKEKHRKPFTVINIMEIAAPSQKLLKKVITNVIYYFQPSYIEIDCIVNIVIPLILAAGTTVAGRQDC